MAFEKHIDVKVLRADSSLPTVRVEGDIDQGSCPVMQGILQSLVLEGHHHIAVDMGKVRFLDSSAVRVLVRLYEEQRYRRGDLRMVAASDAVRRLFSVLKLSYMLPVVPEQPPSHRGASAASA